jgi:hypothetical protein
MTDTPTDAIKPVALPELPKSERPAMDEWVDGLTTYPAQEYDLYTAEQMREYAIKARADLEVYYEHLLRAANADRERLEGEAAQARVTSQFWKDNHLAGNQRIEELEAALAAANARADADARRLDWVGMHGQGVRRACSGHKNLIVWGQSYPCDMGGPVHNIRAIIDDRMRKQP